MNVPEHIFKSYDIRGLYPQEINEENVSQIAKAIYKFLKEKSNKSEPLTIVYGRDMRTSSPSLSEKIITALIESGARVIDIGLVSTPTMYFAVFHYGYDAGIQLTASHNPKDYNGIKIVMKGEKGLIKIGKSTGMEDIKRMAVAAEAVTDVEQGTLEKKDGVLAEEIENAIKLAGNPTINKYKIVADPANAMGALYIDALFEKIPADLVRMNFTLDGTFPVHQADPLQADTLVDLQKKVVEEKADLGLAPDGDGDRLFFIDENGKVVPASYITAIVAREFLKHNPGEKILFDIRYIITPKTIVEENGGTYEITRVGHAFITEKLNESGGIFAGESSAHFFFRANGNAESQLPVIMTILKVMTEENKKLSELVEEVRRSFESGEINFEVTNSPEILAKLKEKYADGELSTLDGIAVSYPDWRFSVRTSNTEPLLRLNVESTKEDIMNEKRDELKSFIESVKK
jgi:phosphomannomutase